MARRDVEGFAVAGFGFGVLSLLMGDPTQLAGGESLKRLVVSSLQKAEFHLVTRPGLIQAMLLEGSAASSAGPFHGRLRG
jgi:hypothetical protein